MTERSRGIASRDELTDSTTSARRVLFVMQYPGYLRYFDSTITSLAARGHEVLCAFEQPQKQAEGLRALDGADARITVLSTFPKRAAPWHTAPRGLRRVADWVRYLDPRFADAYYLRNRAAEIMPLPFRWLRGLDTVGPRTSRFLFRTMMTLEQAAPAPLAARRFIDDARPDVLVVTPLVTSASREPELVKAARARGIPTVLAVASWDHLSSKGIIRVMPDKVVVWNDIQRDEAESLHDVPADSIVVTGAQPWDRWFAREPSTTGAEFRAKVGLPDEPFVLFVGSTASISAPAAELEFVREWVRTIRTSDDERIRGLGVLVRPHPYNPGLWEDADVSDLRDVAVWPRQGANPVDEDDRADYFDSMYHAAAVVGINTSAMIESAIVGSVVLTVRSPLFDDSQGGTVHFSYLLPEHGGFVRVATSLQEHVRQLADTLEHPEAVQAELRRFLVSFVRPHGLDAPSTPRIVDAIEELAMNGRTSMHSVPARLYPLTGLLWISGTAAGLLSRREVGTLLVVGSRRVRRSGNVLARALESPFRSSANLLRRLDGSPCGSGETKLARAAGLLDGAGARASRLTGRAAAGAERRVKAQGERIFAAGQARAAAKKERLRASRGVTGKPVAARETDAPPAAVQERR